VEFAKWLVEIAIAFVGVGGALVTAGYWLLRGGRRLLRFCRTVDRLHVEFGDDPIGTICEILEGVRADHGELTVRQRLAERHLKIGIYVCETNGRCTFANDWLCEHFGIDSRDMLDFGWLSGIRKSDQRRVHEAWTTAIEERLPYEESYVVAPKNGDPDWTAKTEAWPVMSGEEIICYVGYVERVEEVKESNE